MDKNANQIDVLLKENGKLYIHDATEMAYKNGYKDALREMAQILKSIAASSSAHEGNSGRFVSTHDIDRITTELLYKKS